MNNDDRRDEAAEEYMSKQYSPIELDKYNDDLVNRRLYKAGWNQCRKTEVAPLLARVGNLANLLNESIELHKNFHSIACARADGDCFCGEQEWIKMARAALAETQPGGEE